MPVVLLPAAASLILLFALSVSSHPPPRIICNRPCMSEVLLHTSDAIGCFTCSPSAFSPASQTPAPDMPAGGFQEGLQRLAGSEPDVYGTLHLFHTHAVQHAGSTEGNLSTIYEAITLMTVGRYATAIDLLHNLLSVPSSSVVLMPHSHSLRLGSNVPFDVAVLDNLAHALDVVGSIAASCNYTSIALAQLKSHSRDPSKAAGSKFKEQKKHLKRAVRDCDSKLRQLSSNQVRLQNFSSSFTRMLSPDAADHRQNALKELLAMSGSFYLLSNDALFRLVQGIIAVFPSSSAPIQSLLLQTMLASMYHGHGCIHVAKATATNVLIGVIESPEQSNDLKDTASEILSLLFACYSSSTTDSRALHFSIRMLSATITSDVQKYHALIALGRLFDAQFRTAFPLACMATSDITRQLRSAILLLSGGAGLWHLAAATHHANATLRSTATEVLKLAIAYSPSQILESHMQSMVRLQELLSRYSASRSPNNALDLLKYGVTAVNHQHMYYAWVASKTSRLLLQDHGRAQVNTWLQQLVPELGVIVEQFIEKNDWKCSVDAADVNPDLASSGLKRALFASKCVSNTAACSQLYHEYLNCYVVATADKEMFAKFGGPYSRVHCMQHYHAALMCSYTNEEACFGDFQPKSPLGPSILTRVASTRFGPMMFFSPDYYFRVGLGLYGEWSYLEAAKMQAAVREGATVIDVGTHIGTMLLAFAEKVGPTGRVIGIEAQRSLASVAAHNAAVNGHAHVQVINAAVDSSATTCIMSYESQSNEDISNYGGFGVRLCSPSMYQACALSPTGCAPYPAPDVSVVDDEDARLYTWLPAITIDSLQLQRCDLIKFDVEGWESRALRGAAQTISRFKPVLFFEADEAADSAQGSSFTSPFVEEHLHPLGYICFRLSFPLYNEHNFNNVTANFFGQSQSIMVTCSVGSTAEAEPRAAMTEL